MTGISLEEAIASVAAVELTGDGGIQILTGSTEMGQGTKTIFPQLVADALGVAYDDVAIAPQDTALVPDSGPTVASRTAMVVGGLLIKASQRLRATVEEAMGGSFADTYRGYVLSHGPLRVDQRLQRGEVTPGPGALHTYGIVEEAAGKRQVEMIGAEPMVR